MTFQLAFWILMLLWVVLGVWKSADWPARGTTILLFLILLVLGWRVFGAPVHQ